MKVTDFKIRTGKQQSFVRDLADLCEAHSGEEDFDFECYTDESNQEFLIIENFNIEAKNEQNFLKALNDLKAKYAVPAGQAVEFEEDFDTEYFEIYEFYIRTKKQEAFVSDLEKICDKYSPNGDYDFEEYQDEEDTDILLIDNFFIAVTEPEKLVDEVENLCKQYAIEDEYGFGFDLDGEEVEA
jgi:hypothetical protein